MGVLTSIRVSARNLGQGDQIRRRTGYESGVRKDFSTTCSRSLHGTAKEGTSAFIVIESSSIPGDHRRNRRGPSSYYAPADSVSNPRQGGEHGTRAYATGGVGHLSISAIIQLGERGSVAGGRSSAHRWLRIVLSALVNRFGWSASVCGVRHVWHVRCLRADLVPFSGAQPRPGC